MNLQPKTKTEVYQGDCLEILRSWPAEQVDLIYLDPPFFTQREQKLSTRDRRTQFSFDDRWQSISCYASFLHERLTELHRVLKSTGSLFFHCDRTASHVAKLILDEVFEKRNFQSEIIWHYKRWSNASHKLLPAHQTILFYTKSSAFKFNTILSDYSPTTNVDQILQRRSRDGSNKSVYARDKNGEVIYAGAKQGVPLSDVWEIPFLNPKAKERTGYPTQKPILLLERIISLVTDEEDLILDPFCGSGTTLVAASLLGRTAIGIDIAHKAVELTRQRLANPIKTDSNLLKNGIEAYKNADTDALSFLTGIPHVTVQRNKGIDAFLKTTVRGVPIPVRVQRSGETIREAASALYKAARSKRITHMILVATEPQPSLFEIEIPEGVVLIPSVAFSITRTIEKLKTEEAPNSHCQQVRTDCTANV
ncbi:MAG: site-specific DNA-methyltransferase [Blastocatellia bacterium]|nr:site-specific DNA-methyltransferase [Blastocatellia bacterium]